MSEIKAEQIISGIKEMLIKAEAITPKNAHALEEVLNTHVLQNIIDYGKQANGVTTGAEQCSLPVVTAPLLNYSFRDENSELQHCQVDMRNAKTMLGNMMTKLNEVNRFIAEFTSNGR